MLSPLHVAVRGERVIIERSRHASPSFQDHLKLHIDDVRRQLTNTIEIADLYSSQGRLPPGQVRHDIDYFQDRLSHLQSSLEDSVESSHDVGPSPTAHAVASPAPTPVASGSSTFRFSSRPDRRYDQRVASSDIHVLSGRPCSRESTQTSPRRPSSQRFSSSKRSLSPRRTPSPTRRRSASRRTPSPAKRRNTSRRTPSPAQRSSPAGPLRLRGELPPRDRLNRERGHPGTPSLQGEAPLLQSVNVARRETLSPLQLNTLHGPPLGSLRKRGQGHGLLIFKLPLQE